MTTTIYFNQVIMSIDSCKSLYLTNAYISLMAGRTTLREKVQHRKKFRFKLLIVFATGTPRLLFHKNLGLNTD
jgi:hypothetical protein